MKNIIYISEYDSWLKLWNLIKTDPEFLLKFFDLIGKYISSLSIIIGIITIFIAIKNYRSTQKWEKTKLIVKLFEEFDKDFSVRNVRKVLDYNCIEIIDTSTLPPYNDGIYKIIFDREAKHLSNALTTGTTKNDIIPINVQFIRDDFDVYFNKMLIFKLFIDKGKVEKELVYDYFKYDVECMYFDGTGENEGRNNKQVLAFVKKFHNNAYKLIIDIAKKNSNIKN